MAGWILGVVLFLLPVLHPLLIPLVGVPSHLLWFVHVVVVGGVAFFRGPRGFALTLAASVAAVAAGEATFGAGYGIPADGETIFAITMSVGLVGLLAGVAALMARRQALQYEALFENAPVGLLQVDGEGVVRRANDEARRMFEIGEAQPRTPLSSLLPEPEIPPGALHWSWEGPLQIPGPSDVPRVLHVDLTVERARGSDDLQVMIHDRSMEVNQSQELERQARLASLGEMLAGVAHELNNPLSIVMAHAHLGRDGGADAAREALDVIVEGSERMKELLEDLLSYSRPREASEISELSRVVRRIASVQEVALPPGITLVVEPMPEVTVPAAASRVEQVVLNLLGNAVDELSDSGAGGTIVVRLAVDPDAVRLQILDDGAGIHATMLDRIFEPFVTTKPEGTGTGLGLAICRRLARGWGGDLVAENRETGGARFTVLFPRAPAPSLARAG